MSDMPDKPRDTDIEAPPQATKRQTPSVVVAWIDLRWAYVYDVWRANWPCLPSSIAIIAVGLVLFCTDAAQDILLSLATDEFASPSFWSFVVGAFAFGVGTWYWALRTLECADGQERNDLIDYRIRFPPIGIEPGSDTARESAKHRVELMEWYRDRFPAVWGILAFAVVGIATLLTLRFEESKNKLLAIGFTPIVLAAVFILQVLLGLTRYKWLSPDTYRKRAVGSMRDWIRRHALAKLVFRIILFLPLALYALIFVLPISIGQYVNPAFSLLAIVSVFIVAGSYVSMAQRRVGVPILLLVLVGLYLMHVVLSYVPSSRDSHPVRLLTTAIGQPVGTGDRMTVEEAAAAWWQARTARLDGERPPFIIVATAGGGSRAAFWTATVLGHLTDQSDTFADHLFAISGVSGGSVGAVFYRAILTQHRNAGSKSRFGNRFESVGQAILGENFLGPVMASMFGVDIINDLAPFLRLPDRAAALERAWEIAFKRHTNVDISNTAFSSLWQGSGEHPWPALFLNGTVVETGERIITSNLLLDGELKSCTLFVDAMAFTASDFRISTAANNSARFPYVEPSGALVNGSGNDKCPQHLSIVDGGYFENFGAITALQVLDQAMTVLEGDVIPIVIVISSDPAIPDDFGTQESIRQTAETWWYRYIPVQQSAPIRALYNTRAAIGELAVHQLRERVDELGGKLVHLQMCMGGNSDRKVVERETAQPPLSWALSEVARRKIRESRLCPDRNNQLDLKAVVDLLAHSQR